MSKYSFINKYFKTYQFFQLVLKSEDMLLAFCIGHFIAGCVSAYRIFALSNGCHNLMYEIKEAKKSLNELTILKYKVKLVKSRIFYLKNRVSKRLEFHNFVEFIPFAETKFSYLEVLNSELCIPRYM